MRIGIRTAPNGLIHTRPTNSRVHWQAQLRGGESKMSMLRKTSSKLARVLRFPLYLWILGIYPILHLYAVNFGLVEDNEVAHALAGMLAATTIAFAFAKRLEPNQHKRALVLALWSLAFSLSGHLYQLMFMPGSLFAWTVCAVSLTLGATILLCRRLPVSTSVRATPSLNLIAFALVAMQLAQLAAMAWDAHRFTDASRAFVSVDSVKLRAKAMDSPSHPDIYYIIPDGYPSDEWHMTKMNIDNSAFTDALRERGFVIAPHAQSNYGFTLPALAANLNMRYYEASQPGVSDLDYLQMEIAYSKVARLLLERGYTLLQLMSGFLLPSPIADENIEFGVNGAIRVLPAEGRLSPQRVRWGHNNEAQVLDMLKIDETGQMPFTPLYFETTLLRIALPLLEDLRLASGDATYGLYAPRRYLATLEELERVAQRPEATFTIAHLLKPHGPLTFDENGDAVESTWFPSPQAYEAELSFVNRMFLKTLDSILASSDGQALIIFQADHATIWGRNNPRKIRPIQFDVYAAYFLPDGFDLELPQPYTTINSFTLILNEVFDMGLTLQPDRLTEITHGYDAPFDQVGVTEEFLKK